MKIKQRNKGGRHTGDVHRFTLCHAPAVVWLGEFYRDLRGNVTGHDEDVVGVGLQLLVGRPPPVPVGGRANDPGARW